MKFILETILIVIIIFFVWNILKRMFLKTFYPQLFQQNQKSKEQQKDIKVKKSKDSPLHWDAETVDYEEIKENKFEKKE